MRNHLVFPTVLLACFSTARAGGVFYNSNQSAEYFRSFDRNSAIDNADTAYYNMAGTVKLKEGFTFNLSNQSIFQQTRVDTLDNPVVGNRSYTTSTPAWIVPNGYMVYRKANWSLFTGIEAIGATATREWKDGLPTLDLYGKQMAGYGGTPSSVIAVDAYTAVLQSGGTLAQAQAAAAGAGLDASHFSSRSYLKGSLSYLALRQGGAYQFSPTFSMAIAARLVYAHRATKGFVDAACDYNQSGHDLRNQVHAELDATESATGYSGEIGFNLYPSEQLVFNLTYEMATPLEFKTQIHDGKNGNGLFLDGKRSRLDLPAAIRMGIGYQIHPDLRLSMGVNVYLEGSCNFSMLDEPLNYDDHSRDYRNTYEEQASIEYRPSQPWLLSFGVCFNQIGQMKASTLDTKLSSGQANYMSIGTGFQYQPSDRWKFNVGLGHTRFIHGYENADVMGDQTIRSAYGAYGVSINPRKSYDKRYFILGLGMEYHF